MDSKHRHDLETNSLAKNLVKIGERLRPHQQTITIAAIAIVALIVLGVAMRGSNEPDPGWQSFAEATQLQQVDFSALETTAKTFEGTAVSEMSRITWADGQLSTGLRQYFTQKSLSKQAIADAKEAYELLESSDDPTIADRAQFGLARVAEAEGDLKAALEAYEAVDSGPFQKIAEVRAKQLGELDSPDELRWLVSAKAVGGGLPSGFDNLPDFRPDDATLPGEGDSVGDALADIFEKMERSAAESEGDTDDGTDADNADSDSTDTDTDTAGDAGEATEADASTGDEETGAEETSAEVTAAEETEDESAEVPAPEAPGVTEDTPAEAEAAEENEADTPPSESGDE